MQAKTKDKYTPFLKLYQRQGIERMKEFDGKLIQGDDMGLGKTLQILAYAHETKSLPCLIVCPASLIYNWKKEIKKWLDCEDVFIVKSRYGAIEQSEEALKHSFIIISYDNLIYWTRALAGSWLLELVVFDEAHLLKEYKKSELKMVAGYRIRNNQRVTAADELMFTPKKIFATGTPVANTVMDLYNFMRWLDPEHYSILNFQEKYAEEIYNPITREMEWGGGKNLLQLNEELKIGFMLRRRKREVLKELPLKQRVLIPIEPDTYVRKQYELAKSHGLGATGENPCALRMEMRKALIPCIVKNGIDFIESIIAGGEKIAVFAVFHETMDALKNHFKDKAVIYDGRMNSQDKFNAEKAFQENEDVKVFIGNVIAAGKGITLTAASKALTLEYTDNPTDLTQTEDRINRIGQESEETINFYMHCINTIDDDMVKNINSKMEIITQAVDGYIAQDEDLFPCDTIAVDKQKPRIRVENIPILALFFFMFFICIFFYPICGGQWFWAWSDKLTNGDM